MNFWLQVRSWLIRVRYFSKKISVKLRRSVWYARCCVRIKNRLLYIRCYIGLKNFLSSNNPILKCFFYFLVNVSIWYIFRNRSNRSYLYEYFYRLSCANFIFITVNEIMEMFLPFLAFNTRNLRPIIKLGLKMLELVLNFSRINKNTSEFDPTSLNKYMLKMKSFRVGLNFFKTQKY